MGEVASIYTTVAGLIDCAIKTGAAAEGLGAIPVEGKIQYLGIFLPWSRSPRVKDLIPKLSHATSQDQRCRKLALVPHSQLGFCPSTADSLKATSCH